MQGAQFLFLERHSLLRGFKGGLGLPGFVFLRDGPNFVLAETGVECRLSGFHGRKLLRCRSQFFLERLDSHLADGTFFLVGLVKRLGCADLAL